MWPMSVTGSMEFSAARKSVGRRKGGNHREREEKASREMEKAAKKTKETKGRRARWMDGKKA